jgi:hypothetical protein
MAGIAAVSITTVKRFIVDSAEKKLNGKDRNVT